MRRLLALLGTLVLAGTAAALIVGASAQGSSTYRFDVVFDDARGLIAGQLVKIAGARAGTIGSVSLTPDFKARISAEVEGRFRPFHANATCTIRPEGLIAENYVDCDPGNADSAPLAGTGGHPPTVPVNHTSEPVSLLNLFDIFNLPTRERFMVIIDELGAGLSGQGADLHDVIRRANPTLALANRVIGILDRQRTQLATLIDATNTVAAEAARHTPALQSFIDRSAALTSRLAAHRGPLQQAIARLPGMLGAADPALARLDAVARSGTPLVRQLGAAAPGLDRVARDIGPFAAAAKPGLASLDHALKQAIPALRETSPLLRTLNGYLRGSLPSTRIAGRLFPSLQRTGFTEDLLSVFYYTSTALSRYDGTSHMLATYLVNPNGGACGSFATTPNPICNAHYGSQPAFKRNPHASRDSASVPREAAALKRALRRDQTPGGGALESLSEYLLR